MNVLALPDVPLEVPKDAGEVMVAAATRRGSFPKHAAPDDAAESVDLGKPPE